MSRQAVVLRRGVVVGFLDCERGELQATEMALNELWAKWKAEGFRVLGPAPEPWLAGVVCAVSHITILPEPSTMGLVALELENSGYELDFVGGSQ